MEQDQPSQPTVRTTFKASELPDRLREALHADPDATIDVTATVVEPAVPLPSLVSLIGSGKSGFPNRDEADAWVRELRGEWDK